MSAPNRSFISGLATETGTGLTHQFHHLVVADENVQIAADGGRPPSGNGQEEEPQRQWRRCWGCRVTHGG